ncbi:MAG TPA: beta-galactosidase, partial [Bacteroidales bacterium]|nr:beta-galactosidase [Bacteroidales bacterium]
MTLTFKDGQFLFDDQAFFLQSGEIHYFRIKRDLWEKHLVAAKEAGLNTVSTYVPWAWHEYEEGKFDFTGVSSPERDLVGWLESCKRLGINAIVKPGPFILAEFRGAGLPDWFMEKFSNDVKMRTKSGEMVASDGVNLFNKIYLERVSLWYDNVLPLISKMESRMDGSVIMMQICNEIGVFSWLAHQADYGGDVNERFAHFLQKKYNNIAALNAIWDTKYAVFEEVELPPDGRTAYQSRNDRARDHDWHAFWRVYYGDYLRMLTAMARQRGITVPMYHNLPGWIYGNGYEFPVNITMYEDLFGNKSDILFGVDHIPEFQSYRNLHDDRIINDITAAMQGNGRPLFAAEFQCGSREYHVETNPREMALFYKASVANGLKGWNFYMFSQGKNPPRKGY